MGAEDGLRVGILVVGLIVGPALGCVVPVGALVEVLGCSVGADVGRRLVGRVDGCCVGPDVGVVLSDVEKMLLSSSCSERPLPVLVAAKVSGNLDRAPVFRK